MRGTKIWLQPFFLDDFGFQSNRSKPRIQKVKLLRSLAKVGSCLIDLLEIYSICMLGIIWGWPVGISFIASNLNLIWKDISTNSQYQNPHYSPSQPTPTYPIPKRPLSSGSFQYKPCCHWLWGHKPWCRQLDLLELEFSQECTLVDGRNPANHLGCIPNLENTGINCLSTSWPDFFHEEYHLDLRPVPVTVANEGLSEFHTEHVMVLGFLTVTGHLSYVESG